VWDEAVKISGADPDFHRRDLWEAIEAGALPEWELGVQLFSERDAERYSFDVLDPTKIVPEELVPVQPIGRLVLDRNPDNFFAETEQVAFCAAHIVPGIDFSNDPLLAGRIHSYVDTQISRLGGPNFHEIPVNAPIAQVHNNQRDGMHRQALARGRVAYEPNSLAGGCPFQAGPAGFTSFPQPMAEDKVRGKPEKFAEHYEQAALFFRSQSEVERRHIVNAFRFELSKVETVAVRERMVAGLRNVDAALAEGVASGLGMRALPEPLPRLGRPARKPEVAVSPALSLLARPGDVGIRTRRVAILVADGVDGAAAQRLSRGARERGRRPSLRRAEAGHRQERDGRSLGRRHVVRDRAAGAVGRRGRPRRGEIRRRAVTRREGEGLRARAASTLQDPACARRRRGSFEGRRRACVAPVGDPDPGVVVGSSKGKGDAVARFAKALARHRHYERDSDPPSA
jgi:catalase